MAAAGSNLGPTECEANALLTELRLLGICSIECMLFVEKLFSFFHTKRSHYCIKLVYVLLSHKQELISKPIGGRALIQISFLTSGSHPNHCFVIDQILPHKCRQMYCVGTQDPWRVIKVVGVPQPSLTRAYKV